jgi:hypothetical protein
VIAAQKTIIAAEDDDNRQNTKSACLSGRITPPNQNGGIPSTRNAAVGKMQI